MSTPTLTPARNLPGNKPVVFWDFDGVFNFHGTSRNQRRKQGNLLPGYLRRQSVYVDDGMVRSWFTVEWAAELARKTATLHQDTDTNWVWLTTWVNHTHKLDGVLSVKQDYTADWDAYPAGRMTDDELNAYRLKQKLDYVLAFTAKYPDTPWAWVDDEATKLWTPVLDAKTTAPHLVLTPDEKWGVSMSELAELTRFLTNL